MEQFTTTNDLVSLKGKIAIVTGGAKGIGLGIAKRLHDSGASVVVADMDDAEAQRVRDDLNAIRANSAIAVHVDISKEDDVKAMLEQTLASFSRVDILVNNAGIYPFMTLKQITEDAFKKVLDVNLYGSFLCLKYVSEQMIKQGVGGKIINITSIDAVHPSASGLSTYDASKHGLWGLTKSVALELAPHKIWVNAIAPGGILTPGVMAMQGDAGSSSSAVQDAFLAKIPMHRMGQPDEIGKVALFLASDLASYMTGSQIVVDGGALLS